MKSFDFILDEPVEYAVKGETTTGNKITCYAPKPSQRTKAMKLKQTFFQAIPKNRPTNVEADKKSAEDQDITGNEVLFIVAQSEADYPAFIELGRSLICDKNAKIDDVEYITTAIIDKLEVETLEALVGDYVANFIVSSALKSLPKN